MKLLALDLATNVGFAIAEPRAVEAWPAGMLLQGACGPVDGVRYGSHRIGSGGTEHGKFFSLYADWLTDLLTVEAPDTVVFEAPLPRIANAGIEAGRRALGLAATTDLIIYRRGIRAYELSVSTVRKTFCGNGRADKKEVMEACKRRGWNPPDLDTADALALLDAAVHKLRLLRGGR